MDSDFIYLCSAEGGDYLAYYKQSLNSGGIYVKICKSGEEDTYDMFVVPSALDSARRVILSLPVHDNLKMDKELEGTYCPSIPYIDGIAEIPYDIWERRTNNYEMPYSPDAVTEKIGRKRSNPFLWIFYGIPLIVGVAVSLFEGGLEVRHIMIAGGGLLLVFLIDARLRKKDEEQSRTDNY